MNALPKKFKIFFLFAAVSLFLHAETLEPVSIQLKWFYQYQFAGVFMAKEKGFYEEAGLDVTIKERDPKTNNIFQVIKGESEYGIADSVILRYRAQGHPLKVIATIFQHNAMVLISKKESGIVSPFEIRGKKISFQKGLDDSIISSLLKFADLDENDYTKVPMDFTHMQFVRGEVDVSEAYISNEPYWMKKKYGIDLNIIDPKSYGIDFYGDLIFTTEDEIKNHPLRVKAFKEATIKGWQYALEHKDETIKTILKDYNTRNLTYDQLMYEARVTETLIAPKYIPVGEVRKERFAVLANLYRSRGIASAKLDSAVQEIIYDPSLKSKGFLEKHITGIAVTLGVTLIILAFLGYNNRRLNYLVKKRTQELEDALSSKSQFLANMSHEIRTPLNAVLGFVEQLRKGEHNSERLKMFDTVHNSGKTLLNIINDILDFSKIENGKMKLDSQPVRIHDLIESVEKIFDQECQNKMLDFSVKVSDTMPVCMIVDEVRLKQILINLLSNAIKFTQRQGRVTVEVFIDTADRSAVFKVIDTGAGIEAKKLEKIFTPFEQEDSSTTRKFGGTGLGLAISGHLAALMKGTITVESQKGEGSAFSLSIPLIDCPKDHTFDTQEKKGVAFHRISGHILVVEDNKTNQMLLSLILDQLNVAYDIAEDGQEAIEKYTLNPKYDIILMDENMPVMSGIEAVKHIRNVEFIKGWPPTPIIAVTANALEGDRERFLKAGMDDYIAKPYDEEKIRAVLAKYISSE